MPIVQSNRVSVPLVVGSIKPTIILPHQLALTAKAELMDMVLLHELAHVRRGDFAWNLVNRVVRLFYWPHPLVWPLGRLIGAVREQVCDEVCVHEARSATAYRATLLEVASGLIERPELVVGLAMARSTMLARRLAWIDGTAGQPRCVLGLTSSLAIGLATIGLTGLFGSIALEVRAFPAVHMQDIAAPSADHSVAPPRSIDVVVTAKDSGKPLAGANVRFPIDFANTLKKTDRDGTVRLDLTQRKFQDALSFDVWAEGYVQQRFFFAQNDARHPKIPARFRVDLLPGEEILGGKVVDEEGRPIERVKVDIWGYLGEKKEKHELAYMVDANTDERGQWRCRCFRSMTFAYLYLSHPDRVSDEHGHPRKFGTPRLDVPQGAGKDPLASLRDFSDVQVMTAGVSVLGMVTDERDKPIAGAEVGCLDDDGLSRFHDAIPVTSTNASGRFRFPHVRPGPLVVQVKAKGHAPELKHLDKIDVDWHFTVKLGPPRRLSGRVEDSRGKPLRDVFVNVDTWRGSRALGVFFNTDADGRFQWDDAPPDAVLLNASRAGFAMINHRKVSPDEKEITFILRRSLTISGRVTDSATDKPIEQADVDVGVTDPRTGRVVWRREQQVFTFQGRLQANIDVEERAEVQLRITANGYAPAVSRIFRRDEQQAEYDARLTRTDHAEAVVLSGIVRRPDGKPLAGAAVTLAYPLVTQPRRMQWVMIRNGELQRNARLTITQTDAAGRFSLVREPDPEGKDFAVVIVHPDFYAEVGRTTFEANSTITAKPWGRVEGAVEIRGQPAAGASVRYFTDRLGHRDVPHVFDEGAANADDSGRFVLTRIVPGDVRVARGFGEGVHIRAWSNGELVVVRAGEATHARVGTSGCTVIARIVPPAGFDPKANYTEYSEFEIESDRPSIPYPKELQARHDGLTVPWARDWWASEQGHEYRRKWYRYGQAKLERDGSIRVDDVPPGDYRLKLTLSADPLYGSARTPDRMAYATKQFKIPEIKGGRTDVPFDLGVLRPSASRRFSSVSRRRHSTSNRSTAGG